MNPFRQTIKSFLTTFVPRQRLLAQGPRSTGDRPRLALTFDDGPHPEYTPAILDRLKANRLKATFYVVGSEAERYPDLIRRICAEGHEIGNHTYSHAEPRQISAEAFLREVEQTDELLVGLTGRPTWTMRPPKGEMNWPKLRGLWQRQKTVVLWNIDPKDFRMTNADQMTAWCDGYQPRDGDVVLLHDSHPFALRAIAVLTEKGTFHRFEATTIAKWVGLKARV